MKTQTILVLIACLTYLIPAVSAGVVTDAYLNPEGSHTVGGGSCGSATYSGSVADCGGGTCYGNQRLCVLKRDKSTAPVVDVYFTPEGQHVVGGPGCESGYTARGSVADCGGGTCHGNQQLCVKTKLNPSRAVKESAVTDVYLTSEGQHVVGGPGCQPGYAARNSIADCGGGTCYGNQELCVKVEKVCSGIYEPVCGVDGNTYYNLCYAAAANVLASCLGECPCPKEIECYGSSDCIAHFSHCSCRWICIPRENYPPIDCAMACLGEMPPQPDCACENGECVVGCQPSCAGRECGPDGCGGICGACIAQERCINGKCTCTPNCMYKDCGPDGCGGTCGDCPSGERCVNNQCIDNQPPVVDGISGPTQLDVNEAGTWTVSAHDPEDGYLSYYVDWGDNAPDGRKTGVADGQTATFTHSYSQAGSYTARFTVTDDQGQSAQTSISVSVGGAPGCRAEGETCGGIANIQCCDGLACKLDGSYPDASGVCKIPCSNSDECPQIRCIRAPCPEYACVSGFCEMHTCGNGKCETGETKQNCPQDCASCTDSDGGRNYYVKGTTKGDTPSGIKNKEFTDYCVSSSVLEEYYCAKGLVYDYRYTCPNGCADGACITGEIKCYSDSDCPPETERYCLDLYTCVRTTNYRCVNPGTVDAYCRESGGGAGCTLCPYGCEDGYCIESPRCTDSDRGRNIYVKGITCVGGGSPETHCEVDQCIHRQCIGCTDQVREYYCQSTTGTTQTSEIAYEIIDCPGSCSYGACVFDNYPPAIDGIIGPPQLDVNEVGTWYVIARDPENGSLSYSVDWGDNAPDAIKTGITDGQTATFTHSYSKAGSYTARFTVTDDHGQSARASLSVRVVGAATCSDSDGGRNYYVKGTVTLGSESKTDSCTYCTGACLPGDQDCVVTCGAVVEYYCRNDMGTPIASETHVCPNQCFDGACKKKCAEEGEYTSGSVSPQYSLDCCEGLEGYNTHPPGWVGGGLLCYDPSKGTPVCKYVGTRSEGWYYSGTGGLLRYERCGTVTGCSSDNDCSNSQFCEFEGCLVETGKCTNVPEECPTIYAPVCGCDGNTYSNECVLHSARVSKKHNGECEECETDEDCDDDDQCTIDSCENGKCMYEVNPECAGIFGPGVEVEAEEGRLASPMKEHEDSDASNGEYIATSEEEEGSASYTFKITEPGEYIMKAKVRTPEESADSHDSFYVGVDDQDPPGKDYYVYDTLHADSFTWDTVSLRGPDGTYEHSDFDPMVWNLAEGEHVFTFYGRETNTQLDQVMLEKEGGTSTLTGDLNGDGVVDILDLVAVAQYFGQTGSGLLGDINGDNEVNIMDLVAVALNFGKKL